MSAQELITDHLDLWTGAVTHKSGSGRSASGKNRKIELTGIKKLRELILELAVRGKLVEQDPSDEPASVLLERIAEEKARLVKEGKVKKPKNLKEVADEEKPFGLPEGWAWARMEAVSEYIQRGKGPKYAESGKVRVISQKCVQWSGLDLSTARFVDDNSLKGYQDERYIRKNDILWNSTGTGTVGRAIVVKESQHSTVIDSHVTIVRPLVAEPSHILNYISSPSVQQRIEPDHENSLVSGSTKQVELNSGSVKLLAVPLPPLSEQHRIVKKVDELMAICDRLEQQVGDQLEAHKVLVDTLLDALTHSTDAAELAEHWARVAEHFDTLFTTEASIDKLKQTILQLAVMGRLVEQDPNDEPARVLLERIAEETDRLVTEGKIKKVKNLPPVKDEERTFGIPKEWEWVHFSDVVKDLKYGTSKKCYYDPKNTAVLRIPNVAEGQVSTKDLKFAEMSQQEQNDFILSPGDLLFIRSNGSSSIVGRCAIIDKEMHGYAYAGYLVRARIFTRYIHTKYLKLTMDSLAVRKQIEQPIRTTSGVKNINSTELKRIVFPLPPLDEQHRIVDKVEELMALCDQLKTRLSECGKTRSQLAETVVEQALS